MPGRLIIIQPGPPTVLQASRRVALNRQEVRNRAGQRLLHQEVLRLHEAHNQAGLRPPRQEARLLREAARQQGLIIAAVVVIAR